MPSRPVEHDHAVRPGGDVAADLGQVQAGRGRVGVREDEGGAHGPLRADRAEQVGPGVATVPRGPGPGAATRPHPGRRALPADAGFVLEPDLDRLAAGVLGQRSRHQLGEAFLNAACAASSAFGRLGRTDRRAKPSRRGTLPTERSCSRTAKRASVSAPQVDPPPAHHAVAVGVRPALDGRRQLGLLLGRQPRPAPRPGPVAQAGEALGVVAVHPVPERLPVHAGVPRRFLPRGPLQHQRQGEHPPGGRPVRHRLASPRRSPAPGSFRVTATVMAPSADRLHRRSTAPGATRLRARRRVSNSGRWYGVGSSIRRLTCH